MDCEDQRLGNRKIVDEAKKILRVPCPLECAIVERINRFVVKVLIDSKLRRAYINNTGRLPEYLVNGRKGFCIRTEWTEKTDCRLFSIREDGLGAIIDTQLQMRAFEKAARMKLIPWLRECRLVKGNAKLEESLLDYLFDCRGDKVYLEVKSAVLRDGRYAMYPDCPSSRGRRHLKGLRDHVRRGGKGIVLFIAALPEIEAFKPNDYGDPEIRQLLQEAHQTDVKVKSIGLYYNPDGSFVCLHNPDLRVEL
jgi:sugar fermentation stimulation protein A